MESIFTEEDLRLNPHPGFWARRQNEESLGEVEREGVLRVGDQGKPRYFVLQKNILFMGRVPEGERGVLWRPLKSVNVSWKQFDPFVETTGSRDLFGFRLGSGSLFEDFYAGSQEELDQWIPCFQALCVLVDMSRDFRVVREIGRGSFAEVSLAEDREEGRSVAVKSVHKSVLSEVPENLQNHIQEIKALRKLEHPRIIKLLRVYEDEHSIYLVLDYLRGGDLYNRITTKQRYSELSAASLFRKVLEVVAYIHSEGFVHRDIKPENILMMACDDDCEFKLGDFGLAAEIGLGSLSLKCGSPGYLAPEMWRHLTYGPQVDMFSCGVLLYILLSGKPPFEGRDSEEVMSRNREARIYFQQQYWSDVSKEAIELVLKLTHPDPTQRLTSAQALSHAWLTKKSFAKTIRPSRVGLELHSRPSDARISHELMLRTAGKSSAAPAATSMHPQPSSKPAVHKQFLASMCIPLRKQKEGGAGGEGGRTRKNSD